MEIRQQIKLFNIALSSTMGLYRIWAKKHRVNYNTLSVLYTIDELQICTQKQICDWWALPKQTVHGILLDFEKKGYIATTTNGEDKRERLISFTESGNLFASSILKPLHAMEEAAMCKMGGELRGQLIASHRKYYELFEEEIENGSFTG